MRAFVLCGSRAVQGMLHDNVITIKQRAAAHVYALLVAKPEQERNLLALLVDKLVREGQGQAREERRGAGPGKRGRARARAKQERKGEGQGKAREEGQGAGPVKRGRARQERKGKGHLA